MPLTHDSDEFTHLATRWLDGVASDAEAERLFAAIQEDKACAQAFAAMGRFELLLEQTSSEIAREAVVAVVAEKKTVVHNRRKFAVRALKAAAIFALLGVAVWMLAPEQQAEIVKVEPKVLPPRPKKTPIPVHRIEAPMVARTDSKSPPKPAPEKPLPKVLDDFFLTSLSFDHVTLREALKAMEEQMRGLNYLRRAELDRLHVMLPAEAANREITFHSGAISFLKALRALAGLADCDLDVSTQNVLLTARNTPGWQKIESRSVESILPRADNEDQIAAVMRIGELITDAISLGMVSIDSSGKLSEISGTRAQFEALDQMTQSRAQVRAMTPLQMMAIGLPPNPAKPDGVLTEEEVKKRMQQIPSNGLQPQRISLQPATDLREPSFNNAPGGSLPPDIMLTAQPAGEDKILLTIHDPAVISGGAGAGDPRIIEVILSPDQGLELPNVSMTPGKQLRIGYQPPEPFLGPTAPPAQPGGGQLVIADGSNITGNGRTSITKSGTGTLTLSGQNGYTGDTAVVRGQFLDLGNALVNYAIAPVTKNTAIAGLTEATTSVTPSNLNLAAGGLLLFGIGAITGTAQPAVPAQPVTNPSPPTTPTPDPVTPPNGNN